MQIFVRVPLPSPIDPEKMRRFNGVTEVKCPHCFRWANVAKTHYCVNGKDETCFHSKLDWENWV